MRGVWWYKVRRASVVDACAIALLLGLFVSQAVAAPWAWLLVGTGAVLRRRRQDVLTCACLAVCCFGAGLARGSAVQQENRIYEQLALRSVVLVGTATQEGVYGDRSQLTFVVGDVRIASPRNVRLRGDVKVAGFGENSVYRGDTVRVSGKLFPTRGNTLASISFAQLRVLGRGASPVDELRRRFAAGVQSALPDPQASFGLGLLIGQRSTLPADASRVLLMAGLTHLIAVSGYNLTIIVQAVRRAARARSAYQTLVFTVALISLFLLLTGSSPSIVRASIISIMGLLAWYYGRPLRPTVLLLVAAALSGLATPEYVWGNVSWYLSFLAFFGVLVMAPLVTGRLFGKRRPPLIVQMLIETLCAEAMTAPYLLHVFGQLSVFALPANLLVAAAVPLAMLLCLIAGLAGMLVPALAGWLSWPAKVLLTYMLDVAGWLSRLPHSFLEQLMFPLAAMLLCYAVIAATLAILARKQWKSEQIEDIITEKN
ncbi:MAG TPA: ComEC/Rec2 family competence protein [Bacillota bacterium]|nr:ComEC/Rec2 family competence protein [Bacillota bacterium]